jgi:DNA-directed RNA polymerase subunit N (RpoN/RPB10)
MTLSLPGLSWFRSWFSSPSASASVQHQATPEIAESKTLKLDRMFVFQGTRSGSSKELRLIATEIGPGSLMFRSNQAMQEGEMVGVEILLQGIGNVRAHARVEWLLMSNRTLTGELKLSMSSDHQAMWAEFIRRQRSGIR